MGARSDTQQGASAKRDMLESYLRREVADGGHYFKSRKIAVDIDLSAKEIGAMLRQFRETGSDFSITKWGYSGGTTWYIERDPE
ncbi:MULTISPECIES: hypothetical protein [unclassified Haladaptatus]|uniref:DUF7123 family protein n=1 Tax=unclassified Haladaptatus TaxID=2622732 RepID=UPI0007B4B764|nr:MULTISPECIES: hypothetical protein [unclassified Haladaptatus]KZN26309.1 hypothetical protein A4G99_21090 [Haladaptatus sp. R4]MCO8246660.1 hypothetical protein [Haladaptatus sp. AB643]MCO8256216.1 hypothetical protein [Haladaptatus sp. AB618]